VNEEFNGCVLVLTLDWGLWDELKTAVLWVLDPVVETHTGLLKTMDDGGGVVTASEDT